MNSDLGDAFLKATGAIALVVVVLVGASVLNGWTLSVLWRWFMVPIFGLPALSIPQAIGVVTVIGYMTKDVDAKTDSRTTTEKWVSGIVALLVRPTVSLAMGWVVLRFM